MPNHPPDRWFSRTPAVRRTWSVTSREPRRLSPAPAAHGAAPRDAPSVEPRGPTEKTSGFLRSILANWAGEAVAAISGFLLPRPIRPRMTPAQLGLCAYGWSSPSLGG